MAYLNRLLMRGEGAEFSDLIICLYANYDRSKLLPFLRKAESYKLDQALEICKNKDYNEEVFFYFFFNVLDVIFMRKKWK